MRGLLPSCTTVCARWTELVKERELTSEPTMRVIRDTCVFPKRTLLEKASSRSLSPQLFSGCCFILGGFHSNSPFCLGEEEEVEVDVQEDFLSFDADLVAEQLTFMDAVRPRRQ